MKYIPHLSLQLRYYSEIERLISDLFDDMFFRPIMLILRNHDYIMNSKQSHVVEGILSGRIKYANGRFYGKLSSKISRELKGYGAVFDKRIKTFRMESIPADIQMAISQASARRNAIKSDIHEMLGNLNVDYIVDSLPLDDAYGKSLSEMDKDFTATTSKIGVVADITPERKSALAEGYSDNLKKYIKGFTEENIRDLRSTIEMNALGGGRSTNLIDEIMANHNKTRAKAKFLARQETSLVLSKFREIRYKDVGITKYRWRGSMDRRERPDHKALEGMIFSFDSPPITDLRTGARNNPGEDFGCRCVALPIID